MHVYMYTTIVNWRIANILTIASFLNILYYFHYFYLNYFFAHMTFDTLIVLNSLEFDVLSIIS
jgi:hypothetical protein